MSNDIMSPERLQRCGEIAQKVIFNWQRTNSLTYVLRATDAVHGLALAELRARRFLLGLTEQDLVELPLNDVLMVFALVEGQVQAFRQFQGRLPPSFQTSVPAGAAMSEEQAARILAQLRVETPHDEGKFLRVAIGPPPGPASAAQPPEGA
jgi:hypothetical protein